MTEEILERLLNELSDGKRDIKSVVEELRMLPYTDLGYAKIDNHRGLRTGVGEAIYTPGKALEQLLGILDSMVARHAVNIMCTRCPEEYVESVSKRYDISYHEQAGILIVNSKPVDITRTSIGVVAAGTADYRVAEEAAVVAQTLGNRVERIYDVGVAGLHRLLDKLPLIRSCSVVIAVAGMEGALASVVGGLVDMPLIAVPTSVGYGTGVGGLSAVLSMLNSCASGITVVNIDNGFGAALAASRINKLADAAMAKE